MGGAGAGAGGCGEFERALAGLGRRSIVNFQRDRDVVQGGEERDEVGLLKDEANVLPAERAGLDQGARAIHDGLAADGDLAGGRKQMSFTVQGPDKLQSFFLFTTVGENYLQIAGDGELALIEEIARTMRPLNIKQ